MRRLFLLKPDVAGGIDAPTLLLHAARPPIVENLHYYSTIGTAMTWSWATLVSL
jgi:hypothetical protein